VARHVRCGAETRAPRRVRVGRAGDEAGRGDMGQEQGEGLARVPLRAALVALGQLGAQHEAGLPLLRRPLQGAGALVREMGGVGSAAACVWNSSAVPHAAGRRARVAALSTRFC